MALRDHEPVILDQFNGLWQKGEEKDVPQDHFADCNNVSFIGTKSFGTRDGVDIHQDVAVPLQNVLRIYNYVTQDKNTLLVLVRDDVALTHKIYHVVDATTVHGPILTIAAMTDFAFVPYAGRAYISPFFSTIVGDLSVEKGLQNQFVYVYKGDGTAARKAAGNPAGAGLTVANGAAGHTDEGHHNFAVVFETDTGYLTAPASFTGITTSPILSVSFSNVPISAQSHIVKRHIVATKIIGTVPPGGLPNESFTYYFIPDGTINDNVTTTLNNISFFDADLLDDASYLFDNYSEIPAGAVLGMYNNRMIVAATFTDISLAIVSTGGEPEAINQIDGLLIVPLDGNPITNAQELRDMLYVFKRNKTVGYVDNDDVPSTWEPTIIDQALGCPVHGVATVIDQGTSTIDFLLIATYAGMVVFNGKYIRPPELSWKISKLWEDLDQSLFKNIQVLNDSLLSLIYLTLPNRNMLVGNYANGMDPKGIRWTKWSFNFKVNTIALVDVNTLILGADSGPVFISEPGP